MEYIEREAAIDCLNFVCVPQCRKYAQEEISKLHAADVAPVRHGRWRYDEGEFACSECDGVMVRNVFSYCPWCGAKMDKEREG